MKNKITLFLFFGLIAIVLCSYRNGAASVNGTDGTGAEGTGGCGGGGCHGSTSANAVTIELDTVGGSAVTSYQPGGSYSVKITGTNATGATLPRFGFQIACVLASGAGTSSAAQAGTWGASLPANVQNTAPATSGLAIPLIEHSNPIVATSGTGANGTVYTESIPWTAPAAGTGSMVIYGVINAVNFNNGQSGDHYQQASPVTITEAVSCPSVSVSGNTTTLTASPSGATSYQWYRNGNMVSGATAVTYTPVASGSYTVQVASTGGCTGTSSAYSFTVAGINEPSLASVLEVYPTLTTGNVNVKINGAANTLMYSIYGLDGRIYDSGTIAAGVHSTTIDMSNNATGLYILRVEDQNRAITYKLVKE